MSRKVMYTVVVGEGPRHPGDFEYGFLCEDCASEADAESALETFEGGLSGDESPQANTCGCGSCGLVVWPVDTRCDVCLRQPSRCRC